MHPATHVADRIAVEATRLHDDHLTVSWRSDVRYDHVTGERTAITEAVPRDLRASSVSVDGHAVRIDWSDTDEPSLFDPAWLRAHAYDEARGTPPSTPERTLWVADYAAALTRFDHAAVLEDDSVAAAMIEAFERTGLVLIRGMPTEPNEVERFANHFAYVREIAFDRVADIRVKVDYSSRADTLSYRAPITLGADGTLSLVRHANWTTQPLSEVPFDEVPAWYDAYRAFAALINDPANVVRHRCEPGEAFLIDNHRVLHGRAAFDADEGVRHFQQVYMEADDLSGRRRLIELSGGAS